MNALPAEHPPHLATKHPLFNVTIYQVFRQNPVLCLLSTHGSSQSVRIEPGFCNLSRNQSFTIPAALPSTQTLSTYTLGVRFWLFFFVFASSPFHAFFLARHHLVACALFTLYSVFCFLCSTFAQRRLHLS